MSPKATKKAAFHWPTFRAKKPLATPFWKKREIKHMGSLAKPFFFFLPCAVFRRGGSCDHHPEKSGKSEKNSQPKTEESSTSKWDILEKFTVKNRKSQIFLQNQAKCKKTTRTSRVGKMYNRKKGISKRLSSSALKEVHLNKI